MSFALIFAGLLMLVSGVRGTQDKLVGLVKQDFTGPNNFTYWTVAVLLLGSIGYARSLRPLSNGLLVLLIVVMFLARGNPNGVGGGFFQQFMDQVYKRETSPTTSI